MKKLFKSLFILLFFITISVNSENIKLIGSVPFGIDNKKFEAEYTRILSILDPLSINNRTEIIVEYYKSSNKKGSVPTLPEWGGGGAIGMNRVVIPIDKKPIYKKNSAVTISHELVHIAINRVSNGSVKIPRFFHEGVAMHLSGDISVNEQSALSMALFTNSLIPLASIDSVNAFTQSRAQLAYAQSRLTLDYLIKNYDREIISLILNSSVEKGSFENGLMHELDLTIHELDSLSRLHIAQTYSNFFWILDNYIIWISIILLFFAAYVLTRIRNRKKMKALEEADLLEEERLTVL